MNLYKVGYLYSPQRVRWPETVQYNFRGQDGAGEHELVIFLDHPSNAEVEAIRKGQAEFALFTQGSLVIFLYRFGRAIPWSDAPYSIHLVPPEQRTLPPVPQEGAGMLLNIVLVDADTGIIQALRAIGMPADFTAALHQAITRQADQPFTRASYNGELEDLYRRYTSADLVRLAGWRFESRPDR